MGFYAEVQQVYGRTVTRDLKAWSSWNMKLAAARNRRVFLLECKRQGLLPKHMSSNMNYLYGSATDGVSSRQVQSMRERSLRVVLQFEIMVTVTRIGRMEGELSRLWQCLEESLPGDMLGRFLTLQSRRYDRLFMLIREGNLRKVRALSDEKLRKVKPQDRWIRNISGTVLPDRVINLLALGPKFGIDIPGREISLQRLLSDVEFTINLNESLTDEGKNIKRAQATNIITNYIHPKKLVNNIYQREFYHCQRFLREHPDLLVLKSDKGGVTVVMNKSEYVQLSNNILHDEKYYKLLSGDPTITIQTKCNVLIKSLVTGGYITAEMGKKLFNYNSIPARFYGLPKIHKPTLSMRPIISSINTPTSNLSGFVSDILSSYLSASRSRYYVEDSFAFASFIDGFQLPEDYVLISLDVVSLFSNIPVELAVLAVESRWDSIKDHTTIPRGKFISLIRFLFSSNYFVLEGRFYKQILGSPMGSKFSPSMAEVVMDFFLDLVLADVPFSIPFIKKYVDDLLLSVPRDKVAYTLESFNRQHEYIKFTLEEETERSVPFLDTRVIRTEENVLMLDWYRKPSNSGRYLHYCSNHPHRQKINMILGLKNRIQRIVHPTLRLKNFSLLFQLMLENGYPKGLLKRLVYGSTPSERPVAVEGRTSTNIEQLRMVYSSIPLIRGMTSALVKLLGSPTLRIVPRSDFKIDRLYSRTKDRIESEKMCGVVYSIPCSMCDQVYIGQTSQQLKKRISQHKSDVKNVSKVCALADHVRNQDHVMNYDSTRVLECESNTRKRCFLEMVHVRRRLNAMNYKKDVDNISNIYSFLIHYDKFSESELPDVSG